MKFAKETANKSILSVFANSTPSIGSNVKQKYSDVVDILDGYENLVVSVCNKANVEPNQVHVGGAQYTRKIIFWGKTIESSGID